MSKFDVTQPVALAPVAIPKPWGQEIWYTGMEARGVSQVIVDGSHLPLDAYLGEDPAALCNHADVLLLKILDPAPTAVTGDLYFEVHENKQEVYVVAAVDKQAWPDGAGAIRFGMRQDRRGEFADDHAFRQAFLEAVQNYETVRRRLDEGIPLPDDAVREQTLRADMEAFTRFVPLHVGDVVKVPTWTPHALQHGVRVVEFQTATYERYIISFAQAVVTQDHWDSAHAIASMQLDTPQDPQFVPVQPGIERIVEFDDFNVWRCAAGGNPFNLPDELPYAVCMAIGGEAQVGNLSLGPEQACFVPHAAITRGFECNTHNAQLLIAAPGL